MYVHILFANFALYLTHYYIEQRGQWAVIHFQLQYTDPFA